MTPGCGSDRRVEVLEPIQSPPWGRAEGPAGNPPPSTAQGREGHSVGCVSAIAQHSCLDTVSCKDFKLPLY